MTKWYIRAEKYKDPVVYSFYIANIVCTIIYVAKINIYPNIPRSMDFISRNIFPTWSLPSHKIPIRYRSEISRLSVER